MRETMQYLVKLLKDPAYQQARKKSQDNLLLSFGMALPVTVLIFMACYYAATGSIDPMLIFFLVLSSIVLYSLYRHLQKEDQGRGN